MNIEMSSDNTRHTAYTIHGVCATSLISTRYTECVLPLSSLHDTQNVCYLSHLYTIHRVCATSLISTRYTECVLPLSSLHDTQSVCYLSHLYTIHIMCATSLISTRYTECVLPLSSPLAELCFPMEIHS